MRDVGAEEWAGLLVDAGARLSGSGLTREQVERLGPKQAGAQLKLYLSSS